MNDLLHNYYQREVEYLRSEAFERFARRHQEVAQRLGLRRDACDDPHVDHLIHAFAIIAARLRLKLEDEFSEITDGLLWFLAPHLAAPHPASAVVRLLPVVPSNSLGDSGVTVPAGTQLETTRPQPPCKFRTVFPTAVLPLDVASVHAGARSGVEPMPDGAAGDFVLKVRIVSSVAGSSLERCRLASLRFFLGGSLSSALTLYTHLLTRTRAISIAARTDGARPILVHSGPPDAAAFEPHEALCEDRPGELPGPASGAGPRRYAVPPRVLPALRLLSDYAACPQKFLFLDVPCTALKGLPAGTREADLVFHLDSLPTSVQSGLSTRSFQLGCTPVVNLFETRVPVHVRPNLLSCPLIANLRDPESAEVYDVSAVAVASDDGKASAELLPFFGFRSYFEKQAEGFWWTRRTPISREPQDLGPGSAVELYVTDRDAARWSRGDLRLDVRLTCTDAGRPRLITADQELTFGGSGVGGVRGAAFVTEVSRPMPAAAHDGATRAVMSLFFGHQFSLADPVGAASVIRNLLAVHLRSPAPDLEPPLRAIREIRSEPSAWRQIQEDGVPCAVRGWSVQMLMDETQLDLPRLFLLGSVLERVLSGLCPINTMIRSRLVLSGEKKEAYAWPPRVGSRRFP